SEELGGIRWLPRLIDKARAAIDGTLGDYLYGQCRLDAAFLRVLGLDYDAFSKLVRTCGDDEDRLLATLRKRAGERRIEQILAWCDRLSRRHKLLLLLIDLDDGHAGGPMQAMRPIVRAFSALLARYTRYRWPARAALLGLEIDAEVAGTAREQERGAEEEPYRWLTRERLDDGWKALLSGVLIFLIFSYVIHYLQRIGLVVLVIVGAIFFAYLVYPIVRLLNRKLPLALSILIVYAAIIGVVAVGFSYLIPALIAQISALVSFWPKISTELAGFINNPHDPIFRHLPPFLRNEADKLPGKLAVWVQTHGLTAAGQALRVIVGSTAAVGSAVVIFVLAAYLLSDSESIKRFFMGFVPAARRDSSLRLLSELERVIGGYIRGQILVGASVGTLIGVGLFLLHEPYAILIGAFAGALDLIPYVGPVIAFIPAVGIAYANGGLTEALWAAGIFLLANQAEGHIISPNI
ncbi:MAG: AI-2E family transporter, partial [Rhodanobacteraceae bacterium]